MINRRALAAVRTILDTESLSADELISVVSAAQLLNMLDALPKPDQEEARSLFETFYEAFPDQVEWGDIVKVSAQLKQSE